ncbi:ASCH/PUA domain-containing protein [uncultured Pseudacidovorax sp.]|uniref:ASCH/PUA domain-containing protein n=1 Tax=uncultured Pseudacidovorax sp. TaxID=679313 RepID=UPI0025FDC8E9|nr:ASCH/PUA domain-containing protein [uncultured Pseudacidovorax sp.]
MTDALKAAIAAIDRRFQSGNGVPVDKAAVPAAEWAALRDALAAQPAATGLTDMGFVLEAATAGELAAYDEAVHGCIASVTSILDGKDDGRGSNSEPWGALRRRLLALVAAQPAAEPTCEHCGGTGEVLAHAENCHDDLCALNGDEHSCVGRIEPCSCAAQPAAEPVVAVPHVAAPHPELQNALFCYAAGYDGAAAVLIRGWSALVAQVESEVARGDTPWAELLADTDEWSTDDHGVPYHYSASFEDGYMAIYRISEGAAQPARAGGDALIDERAAFEKWSQRANKFHTSGYNPHSDLWEAWQARAALAAAPQPADLVNDSFAIDWLTNRAELHPETSRLVVRFARALAEKLAAAEKKYGYSDGWLSPDWMDECRAKLMEHVAKGDPRDVAAYSAFLWHHGASTAAPQPAAAEPTTPDHTLKTDPEVFQAVFDGRKTFEIRLNDRGFKVGDWLRLRETTHTGAEIRAGAPLSFTGRELLRRVTHVLTGYGLMDGWCCLSLAATSVEQPAAKLIRDRLQNSVNWLMDGRKTGECVGAGDFMKLIEWLDRPPLPLGAAPQPAAAEPAYDDEGPTQCNECAGTGRMDYDAKVDNSGRTDPIRICCDACEGTGFTPVEQPAASTVPATDIGARICRAVAELPDRNSPEDWPEAMLVTHDELLAIVVAEMQDAAPAAVEREALKDWTIHRTDPGDWVLTHPWWGIGVFNTDDPSARARITAAFLSDYAKAAGIGSSKEGGDGV